MSITARQSPLSVACFNDVEDHRRAASTKQRAAGELLVSDKKYAKRIAKCFEAGRQSRQDHDGSVRTARTVSPQPRPD
jgi:hypothetical protein